MGDNQDYYAILGVSPSSEDVVIQAAYRALMRRYHPDTNPSADAVARAKAINEAYAVLSDPAKRKAYDQSRTRSQDEKPSSPPPPRPEKEARPTQDEEPIRTTGGDGLKVAGFIVGALALITLIGSVAGNSADSSASSDLMNVDNLAVDNLVVNDTTALDAENIDMAANGQVPTDLAGTVTNIAAGPGIVQARLTGSPDPIKFSDIESGSKTFSKILFTNGMSAARRYSEDCHRRFSEAPSWSTADHCAAFDYAAAFFDAQVSDAGKAPRDSYFQFQSDNQSDAYEAAGAYSFAMPPRLSRIRSAAESAAREAIGAELAKRETRKSKGGSGTLRLESETNIEHGMKRCTYSDGSTMTTPQTSSCLPG